MKIKTIIKSLKELRENMIALDELTNPYAFFSQSEIDNYASESVMTKNNFSEDQIEISTKEGPRVRN